MKGYKLFTGYLEDDKYYLFILGGDPKNVKCLVYFIKSKEFAYDVNWVFAGDIEFGKMVKL